MIILFDSSLARFEPSHSNTSSNTDKNNHLDKLQSKENGNVRRIQIWMIQIIIAKENEAKSKQIKMRSGKEINIQHPTFLY